MPVTVEKPVEKWTGRIREVQLGATKTEGGTRTSVVTVGGEAAMPFLRFEGELPHRPVVAIEIHDIAPDWPPALLQAWRDVVNDPVAWARKAVDLGADVIALTLSGAKPDGANRSADEAAQTVQNVLAAVGVPLIVYGPGQPDKDNDVLLKVAEVAAGERLALGICEQNNYRTIIAGCLANGHSAIARAPIDVNIQKQLNILISDMGLPLDRVLIDPTTGALGYGLEYTYSVMERLRLAALMGDSMTQMPMICTVGEEAWKAKEAKVSAVAPATWGEMETRAIAWETVTATALLQSGANILVLRHPRSVAVMHQTITRLMA